MRTRAIALATLLAAFTGAAAVAQQTLDRPVGEDIDYVMDTGVLWNNSVQSQVIFATVISVPDVAWIRLYFRDTKLGPGSYLRLTSLWDREVQELDAADLSMWSDTSAYFNGNQVMLEIVAAPGTANRASLDHLRVEYGNAVWGQGGCGICGPDDRTPSNLDWSGRIVSVGCSGTVWNTDSCVVSAGHCVGADNVIEFRVPPSNSDCSINHPPVAEQFPITGRQFNNNGVGDDWAVMTTGTNNQGQKAFQRYCIFMPIAGAAANNGDAVNVWGFGVDSQCTRSQVQQDSAGGSITAKRSTYYEFFVDITFGNSGSGLIKNGALIGIVTHCSDGCPDFATRHDNADFTNARNSLCPAPDDCVPPVNYGAGTPGSGGLVPHIEGINDPKIGSTDYTIRGENTEANLNGFLLVGFAKANLHYGSTTILVDIIGPHLIVPIKTGGIGLPGLGFIEVKATIPNDIGLDGLHVYNQFLFQDSGASSGLSATEGLDTTICCGC